MPLYQERNQDVYIVYLHFTVYCLAFYKFIFRFMLISSFTFISGEEPYHGCTDIKPLLLLLLRKISLMTEYRANFLGIFLGAARWLGSPD